MNAVLKKAADSSFVTGTISNEAGRFSIPGISPGNYLLELSYAGYAVKLQPLLVGALSSFLDLSVIELDRNPEGLQEVVVTGTRDDASGRMDRKSFSVASNISQAGGLCYRR